MTCWEEKFHMGYQEFDLQRQLHKDTRANVMISELQILEERDFADFTSRLINPGLPSSFEVWQGNWQINPHQPTEASVSIRCQSCHIPLLSGYQDNLILADAFVVSEHPIVLQLDSQSVIYNARSSLKHSIQSLEFFSGGFGGWSMASKLLCHRFQVPMIRTIALDHDNLAMQNWIRNYGGHYVETSQTLPWEMNQIFSGNFGIVADIQSMHWRQMAATYEPNLATISSPCISWSGAGKQGGLFAEGGIMLMVAIGICKFLRPRVILFEQVKNFMQHRHYSKVMDIIGGAGYRMVYHKIINASDTLPMHRQRWIGVAFDMYSADSYDMALLQAQWIGDMYPTPSNYGCLFPLTEQEKAAMVLPHEIMQKYFDISFAPEFMKNALGQHRSTGPFAKMPTLMAAYGNQHEFADEDLKRIGLFGHFFAESKEAGSKQLRLWHPLELAHMFGIDGHVCVPKTAEIAWKQLGNAIATNHAAFAIAMVLPFLLYPSQFVTTQSVLNSLFEQHLRADQVQRFETDKTWILADSNIDAAIVQRIQLFDSSICHEVGSIPAGTLFHQQLGVVTFAQIKAIWNADTEIPPQIDISPTIKAWVKLQASIADQHFEAANIRPDVLVDQIVGLWAWQSSSGLVELSDHHTEDYHFQKLQLGQPTESNARDLMYPSDITVLAYFDGQAWITRQSPTPANELFADISFTQDLHNGIGKIRDEEMISEDVVLFASLPSVEQYPGDPFQMSILIPATNFVTYTDVGTDTIRIDIDCSKVPSSEDGERSNQIIREFWCHVLPTVWLQQHGRKAEFAFRNGIISILLKPMHHIVPLPIPDMILVLMMHALRVFLQTISFHTTTPNETIKLKWKGFTVWTGKVPAFMTASWFRRVLEFFTKPINDRKEITMVSGSHQIGDSCTLAELKQRKANPDDGRPILLVVAPMRYGGGPVKQNWDVHIRNQLASTLLPIGVPVEQLPGMTDAVLKSVGRAKLQSVLKTASQADLTAQLIQFVRQAGFSIDNHVRKDRTPVPLKKPRADQVKYDLANMDMENLQLEPGFFMDSEHNPVVQTDRLYPKTTGLLIAREDQIADWLAGSNTISPDPLGAFVVGCSKVNTQLPQEQILVPARTASGKPLILAGCLVQFGERQIRLKTTDAEQMIEIDGTNIVVSITAWKSEFADDQWQELLRKPLQAFQNAFADSSATAPLITTWGISFRAQGKVTDKQHAESVQLHATVDADRIADALRKSGSNGFYIVPKNGNGMPDPEWKIIWLDCHHKQAGAHAEAIRMMSKVAQPFGLVRNKTSYGIRIRQADYQDTWQILKPSVPPPASIADKCIYKVSPLPYGCSPVSLAQWMKHINWEGVPIRPVGPQSWLVASSTSPPLQFHTFNGKPTLIRQLPPRGTKPQPIVVAGGKPEMKQTVQSTSHHLSQDPWANAWANFKPTTVGVVHNAQGAKPAEPGIGSVQQHLQIQDDKIQKMVDDIAEIQKTQQASKVEVDGKLHQLSESIENTQQNFQSQMQRLKGDLEASFAQALATQNQSINSGFQDLKKMFMEQRIPATRRGRDQVDKGDEDM